MCLENYKQNNNNNKQTTIESLQKETFAHFLSSQTNLCLELRSPLSLVISLLIVRNTDINFLSSVSMQQQVCVVFNHVSLALVTFIGSHTTHPHTPLPLPPPLSHLPPAPPPPPHTHTNPTRTHIETVGKQKDTDENIH